ncbi:MAG: DUF2723 domain-containing protein [Anaerolineales bacterium]|nr:MAG: DUF2723 domain-containing protein [Anaerolineales bacterium]
MKRADPVIALTLFIALLALYVRTLAPSLLFGDSAEFQTIASTLGIGHPTGYPVYILLAKLFTFIPIHDVAYRVNLFSAFCAALTISLIYLILRKLGAWIIPALYGSLALALVPMFWKHATIAEIYTPSAACLAFIVFAVLHWKETNNLRWLFIAGLFGGLSLGIHTTVALAAPAILIYVLISPLPQGEGLGVRVRAKPSMGGVLLGIAIFLSSFLLLDSINSPAGYYNTVVRPSLSVWDMTPANFDSPFERLSFLYFPPQFKGQLFAVSFDQSLTRLTDFAVNAAWNLLPALLGIISLFIPRRGVPSRWREAVLLTLAFAAFLVFAVTYNVYDFYVFYIPALLILSIFIGLGISLVLEAVALIPKLRNAIPVALGMVILIAGFQPSLSTITTSWQGRIPPWTDDWESYLYQYPDARRLEAEEIVNQLEDNAILFTDWDYAYDFYYVAHVLQGRTGMSFHETYPQEDVYQLADSAVAYIEANIDTRPIYFSERPSQLANQFKITRTGSGLFRIERK